MPDIDITQQRLILKEDSIDKFLNGDGVIEIEILSYEVECFGMGLEIIL